MTSPPTTPTRTTGATEQQIEDAVQRSWNQQTKQMRFKGFHRFEIGERIRINCVADLIVPPGMVIAPENRVLDEAAMAAIRFAVAVFKSPSFDHNNGSYSHHIDRIDALIAGDST